MPDVEQPEPHGRPLRIAVVPDSFKGTLTASEAAAAMARGVRDSSLAHARGDLELRVRPLADGGEGTLEVLLEAWGATARACPTTDALGRATTARYGLSPSGVGIVEAAQACGLPQVADREPAPLVADTRGVGEVARRLLDDDGAREILLTVGGTATTDGGSGLLSALGARFLDDDGAPLPPGGGGLARLARIDLTGLHPRARAVRWRVACDVTNPLTGPTGAAAVFGPQKGATAGDVAVLDAGLARLAEVVCTEVGVVAAELRERPGLGAGGGLPLLLTSVLGADLVGGSALVAETVGLAEVLAGVDLVLTGEGRFDEQSFHGKVVDAVVRSAPAGVPVVVIAGEVAIDAATARSHGVTAAVAASRGARSPEERARSAWDDVARAAAAVVRARGL